MVFSLLLIHQDFCMHQTAAFQKTEYPDIQQAGGLLQICISQATTASCDHSSVCSSTSME